MPIEYNIISFFQRYLTYGLLIWIIEVDLNSYFELAPAGFVNFIGRLIEYSI